MLYRLLRSINAWYAIVVLWVYVLAFLMAMGLMFVFPPAPLVLMFAGLGGLGIVVLVSRLLHGMQNVLSRHCLGTGVCPSCRRGLDAVITHPGAGWRCANCGAEYTTRGVEINLNDAAAMYEPDRVS